MLNHHVRLNLTKFAFGVHSIKLLGFMVSYRGIDVDPKMLDAI